MEGASNARAAEVWSTVVAALKQAVRDAHITQDELHVAADYLTRLAAAGVMRSLLDVALSMTSLDATTDDSDVTRANPEGPYYRPGAPLREDGNLLEHQPDLKAELLTIHGQVVDAATGAPIPGAELDVWQADENGSYDNEGFHLRGRVRADARGTYAFATVVPAEYTEHDDDPIGELFRMLGRHNYRAGHIHLKVRVADHLALTTQIYMADAAHIDSDYVEGAVSPDLILERTPSDVGTTHARFDIRVR